MLRQNGGRDDFSYRLRLKFKILPVMEEDEDVVFENSPLGRHLREVGFTDFESEKPNIFQNEEIPKTADTTTTEAEGEASSPTLLAWRGAIWRYFMSTDSAISLLPRLKRGFDERRLAANSQEYASVVLDSSVLCEEDLFFLQKFDPILFQENNSFEKAAPERYHLLNELVLSLYGTLCGTSYTVLAAFVCLLAVFASFKQVVLENVFPRYSMLFIVLSLLLIFSPVLCRVCTIYSSNLCHCRNMTLLKNYCSEVKLLSSLLRKSVMTIQEMELIHCGFTLVRPGMSTRVLQQAKDIKVQGKIYPALRQTVLEVTRDMIISVGKATRLLCHAIPLCAEMNHAFSYLATVSLEDICHDLETNSNGREEPCRHEGDMSLHSLKVLCSVAALLQSEFLSRFSISLSSKSYSPQSDKQTQVCDKIGYIFVEPLEKIVSLHQSLQRSYHFHQCSITDMESPERRSRYSDDEPHNKWGTFYDATHSLELHLRSALMKLASVKEKRAVVNSENNSNSVVFDVSFHDMEINYASVKHNLESAMCCWEEGQYRLEMISSMTDPNTLNSPQAGIQDEQTETVHDLEPKYVNINEIVEEKDDQIFEGYTDSQREGDSEQVSLSAEALEKEKRELEESRHLMIELRSVLAAKAKDPLVTSAGFVLPTKPTSFQEGESSLLFKSKKYTCNDRSEEHQNDHKMKRVPGSLLCSDDSSSDSSDDDCEFELRKKGAAKLCLGSGDTVVDKTGKYTDILKICDMNKSESKGPASQWSMQSSFAFSIAAAAAARSRNVGAQEEFYERDDSE